MAHGYVQGAACQPARRRQRLHGFVGLVNLALHVLHRSHVDRGKRFVQAVGVGDQLLLFAVCFIQGVFPEADVVGGPNKLLCFLGLLRKRLLRLQLSQAADHLLGACGRLLLRDAHGYDVVGLLLPSNFVGRSLRLGRLVLQHRLLGIAERSFFGPQRCLAALLQLHQRPALDLCQASGLRHFLHGGLALSCAARYRCEAGLQPRFFGRQVRHVYAQFLCGLTGIAQGLPLLLQCRVSALDLGLRALVLGLGLALRLGRFGHGLGRLAVFLAQAHQVDARLVLLVDQRLELVAVLVG